MYLIAEKKRRNVVNLIKMCFVWIHEKQCNLYLINPKAVHIQWMWNRCKMSYDTFYRWYTIQSLCYQSYFIRNAKDKPREMWCSTPHWMNFIWISSKFFWNEKETWVTNITSCKMLFFCKQLTISLQTKPSISEKFSLQWEHSGKKYIAKIQP